MSVKAGLLVGAFAGAVSGISLRVISWATFGDTPPEPLEMHMMATFVIGMAVGTAITIVTNPVATKEVKAA